jgi:Zn-finger nucleic acid-binding protein
MTWSIVQYRRPLSINWVWRLGSCPDWRDLGTLPAVSAFRDQFEQCPLCGIDLIDARSARGCPQCGGMWLVEAVLTEMVIAMLPSALVEARRLVFERASSPSKLSCPSCRQSMVLSTMHGILVDRCERHGVWFDASELEMVLRRTADPDRPSILGPGIMTPPASATGEPIVSPGWLRCWVRRGETVAVTELAYSIIKIGRIPSAHLRLPDESGASRLHAIIEKLDDGGAVIIDLGSTLGTRVNGETVSKHELMTGDVIGIGDVTIEVEIVGSGTYRRPQATKPFSLDEE